ncbi:holo-[acyl-carrier-protein] synthase [Striga asiatica]|uniref:Holo-[acyl-carrier-protein] synthase n=1 Tax=Striga asiatica TaxID=4170 RepID=A0A5A7R295_STRAF|nr:holo-[acyl-carrier-protein] synthase [Striga asiatica]
MSNLSDGVVCQLPALKKTYLCEREGDNFTGLERIISKLEKEHHPNRKKDPSFCYKKLRVKPYSPSTQEHNLPSSLHSAVPIPSVHQFQKTNQTNIIQTLTVIVLADKNGRQIPKRGHIQSLKQLTLIGRSISVSGERDIIILTILLRKSQSTAQRDLSPENSMDAVKSALLPVEMHRAPFPLGAIVLSPMRGDRGCVGGEGERCRR